MQGASNTKPTPDVNSLRQVMDVASKPAPGGTGSVSPSSSFDYEKNGAMTGATMEANNSGPDKQFTEADFNYQK